MDLESCRRSGSCGDCLQTEAVMGRATRGTRGIYKCPIPDGGPGEVRGAIFGYAVLGAALETLGRWLVEVEV